MSIQYMTIDYIRQNAGAEAGVEEAPIFTAIEKGDLMEVRRLRRMKLDVIDAYGRTPIMLAVERNNVSIVKALLDAGASTDSYGEGLEPIEVAVYTGSVEIVNLFLKRGVTYGMYPITTLLHVAVIAKQPSVINLLLERRGVDINATGDDGDTPLIYAVQKGDITNTTIVDLLIARGADVNRRDWRSLTPLMIATKNNSLAKMQSLLNGGADTSLTTRFRENVVHYAATHSTVDALQALREVCIDLKLDMANMDGETPIYRAIKFGNVDVVRYLLDRCGLGLQPYMLWYATRYGIRNRDVAIYLVNDKAMDVNYTHPVERTTVLYEAADVDTGDCPLLTRLLEGGAQVEPVDPDICSPLYRAIYRENKDTTSKLLEAGGDVNRVDPRHHTTPTFLAATIGNEFLDILRHMVEDLGGDITVLNERGQTILHTLITRSDRYGEVIDYILDRDLIDINAREIIGGRPVGNTALHYLIRVIRNMVLGRIPVRSYLQDRLQKLVARRVDIAIPGRSTTGQDRGYTVIDILQGRDDEADASPIPTVENQIDEWMPTADAMPPAEPV